MSTLSQTRLALTGSSGQLGTVLRRHWAAQGLRFISTDRVEPAERLPAERFSCCDLADADAVQAVLQGVDAVVHLGGISVSAPFERILSANIAGTYNIYEAARRNGIRRVVFASSNHVTGYYGSDQLVSPQMPRRPDSYYGVSKSFGEDLAQLYWDKYGVETVSLRIASCAPRPTNVRMLSSWLSFDDFFTLVERAILAPAVGHTVVYGVSANPTSYWTRDGAAAIGWVPTSNAESFRAEIDPSLGIYPQQGGTFIDIDETTMS